MASLLSKRTDSIFHEILQLGGKLEVKGLNRIHFLQLATDYPELMMERDPSGKIHIMAPVKGGSGFRENILSYNVTHWATNHKNGIVFSASTGFDLPDGSIRSPDISWVSNKKLKTVPKIKIEQEYIPLIPDFIVEIRSQSDKLSKLKEKMESSWMANGVQLAWLIDPYEEKIHIYRQGKIPEIRNGFNQKISGEHIMPGFELDLSAFKLLS